MNALPGFATFLLEKVANVAKLAPFGEPIVNKPLKKPNFTTILRSKKGECSKMAKNNPRHREGTKELFSGNRFVHLKQNSIYS